MKLEKGFKSLVCDILGITPRSYSNYKADGRKIISFFENNFSKKDLEYFLENGTIPSLEINDLQDKTIKFQLIIEKNIFNKLIFLYKTIEKYSNYSDDEINGINIKANALVELIISTAIQPKYGDFKVSFFSESFRESILLILSCEINSKKYDPLYLQHNEKIANTLIDKECESDISYMQHKLTEFIYSLNEIDLLFMEQFSEQLLEKWNIHISNEKRRYLVSQEKLAFEAKQ